MKPLNLIQAAEGLYLSNKVWLDRDLTKLTNRNIGAIVNLTEHHSYQPPSSIHYLQARVADGVPIPAQVLREIFGFIDQHRGAASLLVHCSAGVSRSPGILIGQLMREDPRLSWDAAFRYLNEKRSIWVAPELREAICSFLAGQARPWQSAPLQPDEQARLDRLVSEWANPIEEVPALNPETSGYVTNSCGRVVGIALHGQVRDKLPDAIQTFEHLSQLDVSGLGLTTANLDLSRLAKLERLSLSRNRLRQGPGLNGLANLVELDLSHNRIERLDEFPDMPRLVRLHLHGNRLTELPNGMGALRELEELYLQQNRLRSLPEAIGALGKLRYLSVARNELKEVPASLGSLQSLTALALGKNALTSLPDELGLLDALDNLNVSSNALGTISVPLTNLKQLRRLNFALNELTVLPQPVEQWLGKLKQHGCVVIDQGWQGADRSIPVKQVEPNGGTSGEPNSDTVSVRIPVKSIEEVREPNRCGIVNPSRAFRMLSRIVLDITYKCSLECPNCNRLCGVAPRAGELSLEAVETFVDDSIEMRKKWAHIYIAGGEPALHKDIDAIFKEVLRYDEFHKKEFGSRTLIKYFTNNHSPRARQVLANLPEQFVVVNSDKRDANTPFKPVCVAPIDLGYYDDDNLQPCQESYQCGIALSYRGYYPCAVSAALDDVVMGGKLAVQSLREVDFENMASILHETCRYCGHYFEALGFRREAELMISPTWERLLSERPEIASRLGLER